MSAKQHQHVVIAFGQRVARRQHRVGGAEPFGLHENPGVGRGGAGLGGDVVASRTDHHGERIRARPADGIEHMGEHGAPGDLVQHFRQAGAHALALAGGENDGEAAAFG